MISLTSLFVPATAHAASLKEIVDKTITPLGDLLISLIFALAFIAFLIGMVRFFFSPDVESRKNGKQFAIWGVIGLAVLFSTWGIVKLLLEILTELAA